MYRQHHRRAPYSASACTWIIKISESHHRSTRAAQRLHVHVVLQQGVPGHRPLLRPPQCISARLAFLSLAKAGVAPTRLYVLPTPQPIDYRCRRPPSPAARAWMCRESAGAIGLIAATARVIKRFVRLIAARSLSAPFPDKSSWLLHDAVVCSASFSLQCSPFAN